MAWGKRHLGGGAVQWELGDGETDEAETHEDGGENADEEGTVVPTSDALVQPLAVVVEDVNTSEEGGELKLSWAQLDKHLDYNL